MGMTMLNLLEVNRLHAHYPRQPVDKMVVSTKTAQKRKTTLKRRYEIIVDALKIQLRTQLVLMSGKFSSSNSSLLSLNSEPCQSRAAAPRLVSDQSSSSSDTESDVIEIQSNDGPEFQKHTERERALVGQTVVGRLNVFTPREGPTRYYLNWTSTKLDNICVDPEVIQNTIGFDRLHSGMRLVGYISHLGPDYARPQQLRPYAGHLKFPKRDKYHQRQTHSRRRQRRRAGSCY